MQSGPDLDPERFVEHSGQDVGFERVGDQADDCDGVTSWRRSDQ